MSSREPGAGVLARPVTSYRDAEDLLLSRVRDDPAPYATRSLHAGRALRALLARTGVPLQGPRFLHIAGSKGKGSVALMTEALLRAAGEHTGTYTSPHLTRWNERIRIDGAPVGDDALAAALECLRPHVADIDAQQPALSPGFFDLITAAGMLAFHQAGCRAIVLETGLGGRYDATNVVQPDACCITSIELEHTDKLGPTLEDVAWHKAGIVKPGAPVVIGELPRGAADVVAARAARAGAALLAPGRTWQVNSRPEGRRQHLEIRWQWEDRPRSDRVTIPHPGPHMALNAALALMLTRAAGYDVDAGALAGCDLPARAQVLRSRPWVVVDAAHTPASLAALGVALESVPALERRFVVSATRGKPPQSLARLLAGAAAVTVTRADAMRSAPAAELAAALLSLDPDLPIAVQEDPSLALRRAAEGLEPEALLCACGSTYLAGLALQVLTPD
jgi:dihydrofolate synthase/folylpolyglutamate synthase